MDSAGQFTLFCLCLLVGFIGGAIYEAFFLLRAITGSRRGGVRAVGVALDIGFCLAFAAWTVWAGSLLRLPNLRLYMWIAYATGLIIYLKTLHRIVDFFEKVCYNAIRKGINRRKKSRKCVKTQEKR